MAHEWQLTTRAPVGLRANTSTGAGPAHLVFLPWKAIQAA